jgi:TRAP-type C4-dicarboxylate transport system substrate-binding protein
MRLKNAPGVSEAVRTGTADLGDTVWAPYNPEKFVLATIGDFPVGFLDTPLAEWLAAERLAKEFPEFDKELAANNMKRLTYYGVANIHLISRKPIRKLEDLKGLKVRCSGKLHPVQLKAIGAVPIFIPSVEAYDGLQKGVIDASTCTARWAVSFKYYETPAKYFIRIGLGGDPGMGVMINSGVCIYKETVEKSYKVMKEAGVEFIDFPKADLETWKKLPVLKEQPEKWIDFVVKARGLSRSRVKEILDRYKELVKEFAQKYPRKF